MQLSNPLQLDPSKWEVALSEIQFAHTWYNNTEWEKHFEDNLH